MDAMARVTGIAFDPEIAPRRAGDPPRIVAGGRLAARDLDWRMRYTLDEMVASAWEAVKASRPSATGDSSARASTCSRVSPSSRRTR